MAPPDLKFIQTTITNWTGERTSSKSHEWEPSLNFYRNLPYKRSITNGKLPQGGVTRINRKENLNVSTMSSNSYKLNVQAYGIINKVQI
jgi:hypothetical protein